MRVEGAISMPEYGLLVSAYYESYIEIVSLSDGKQLRRVDEWFKGCYKYRRLIDSFIVSEGREGKYYVVDALNGRISSRSFPTPRARVDFLPDRMVL